MEEVRGQRSEVREERGQRREGPVREPHVREKESLM
jgi:hypothetical protein